MKKDRLLGLLLAAVVLPFFVTEILVATKLATWLTGTRGDERSVSFFVAALFLVPAAILLGGLMAYGIIVFFLKWLNPDHALLAFADIETGLGRHLNPAFRAVHALALRLAPERR